MPRLSVDIDLNYVGSGDRATMLADKPKVEQSIQAVCAREGLTIKRMPSEHAGGKWRLSFVNTTGSSDKARGRRELHAACATVAGDRSISSFNEGPNFTSRQRLRSRSSLRASSTPLAGATCGASNSR